MVAARRENALDWNGSIARANHIRSRGSIDLHEIGCKKTGEIFCARARGGQAWAKPPGGDTLAASGSSARNPARQVSRRACRGSLRNWARGDQARQARGRSFDAGRSLSPSRRLFPARQGFAQSLGFTDAPDRATRRLVRRSAQRALQPARGDAVPGESRKTMARGSPLRSCNYPRLQYPSAPQKSRQRDLSALRAAGFRADRGLYRASPGRSAPAAAASVAQGRADGQVRVPVASPDLNARRCCFGRSVRLSRVPARRAMAQVSAPAALLKPPRRAFRSLGQGLSASRRADAARKLPFA